MDAITGLILSTILLIFICLAINYVIDNNRKTNNKIELIYEIIRQNNAEIIAEFTEKNATDIDDIVLTLNSRGKGIDITNNQKGIITNAMLLSNLQDNFTDRKVKLNQLFELVLQD